MKKKLSIIFTLISSAIFAIHIFNKIVSITSSLDNKLNTSKGSFYEWRFGRIFYTKQGSGSPILLVHDLDSCASAHEWIKITNKLSKTNTVYTIDLLGCGRSDKPNITYTNFMFVQLISDFISNIIKEKTDIITSSYSFPIITMTTIYNKELINKILVSNPIELSVLNKIPTKRHLIIKHIIKSPIIGTFFYNINNKKIDIKKKFYSTFYSNSDAVDSNDINIYYESAHMNNSESKFLYASIFSNYLNINILHALQTMDNSIYIISSEDDFYLSIAQEYKKLIPSIEIAIIKGTAKYPHLENPKCFLEQISIFFDEQLDT